MSSWMWGLLGAVTEVCRPSETLLLGVDFEGHRIVTGSWFLSDSSIVSATLSVRLGQVVAATLLLPAIP
jgi:hypothetical protein